MTTTMDPLGYSFKKNGPDISWDWIHRPPSASQVQGKLFDSPQNEHVRNLKNLDGFSGAATFLLKDGGKLISGKTVYK